MVDPRGKKKEIERSAFRNEIFDYEKEHDAWEALKKKLYDRNLKNFKCPHCGKHSMGYSFGRGSSKIQCLGCRRFIEGRGKPDWAIDAPTAKFFDVD